MIMMFVWFLDSRSSTAYDSNDVRLVLSSRSSTAYDNDVRLVLRQQEFNSL